MAAAVCHGRRLSFPCKATAQSAPPSRVLVLSRSSCRSPGSLNAVLPTIAPMRGTAQQQLQSIVACECRTTSDFPHHASSRGAGPAEQDWSAACWLATPMIIVWLGVALRITTVLQPKRDFCAVTVVAPEADLTTTDRLAQEPSLARLANCFQVCA